MSVEAMTIALSQQLVREQSARHVLLCLANSAHEDGDGIFPSVARVARETGMSERSVQYKLRELEALGAIGPGDQALAQARIKDGRRVPRCYRMNFEKLLASVPPRDSAGRQASADASRGATVAPHANGKGCNPEPLGVQPTTLRGATGCTRSVLNPTEPSNRGGCARETSPPAPDPVEPAQRGDVVGSDPPVPIEPAVVRGVPADWSPCADTKTLFEARGAEMPARWVVDGFVAHWQGRDIEPRRIPAEFLKWACRQRGMNGGRMPTDAEPGMASRSSLAIDPAALAAWNEVREAGRTGKWPEQWSDPRTRQAIRAMGGSSVIEQMDLRQVEQRKREFVEQFNSLNPDTNRA